jgi:hypothetical protein
VRLRTDSLKSEGELKGSVMVVRGGEDGVNVLYSQKILVIPRQNLDLVYDLVHTITT